MHMFFVVQWGKLTLKRWTTHILARIKQLIKHLSVSNQWWINFKWIAMQVATNANEFKFSHLSIHQPDASAHTRMLKKHACMIGIHIY